MNQILKQKYPYLMNMFETALKVSKLSHSIILYGSDIFAEYAIALEIARMLNCKNKTDDECNCYNCNWIRTNKHPAVVTVSKIDNKNDDSKTVISEKQINEILNTTYNASEYQRVFIFCDAELKQPTDFEKKLINEFKKTGYDFPQSTDNGLAWIPQGINTLCFQDVAANEMLKSIEEPPPKVSFIFLTNSLENLISTIVSRSQAFYVPNFLHEEYNTSFLVEYFKNYPEFNVENAFSFVKMLSDYSKETNLSPEEILNAIQVYLKDILKLNSQNKLFVSKVYDDIKKIEQCKKMIYKKVKDTTVYLDLAFYLAKNNI